MSVSDILSHSKFISAPVFSKKSVPNRPAACVGSGHTRNGCLYCRPSSVKETNCCPFMSSVSPVTPYGFAEVTLTSPVDMPGCIIDTLEPVSKIRRLAIPSISTEIVGAPDSNRTETENLLTALSWLARWKELS